MMKANKQQKRIKKLYEDLMEICNEFVEENSVTEVIGALEGCKAMMLHKKVFFKGCDDE